MLTEDEARRFVPDRAGDPQTDITVAWVPGSFEIPLAAKKMAQVGGFDGDRGEFYGDDTHEGVAIRVRYIWSEITPSSARWDQAFSTDRGRSWETNWICALTRDKP